MTSRCTNSGVRPSWVGSAVTRSSGTQALSTFQLCYPVLLAALLTFHLMATEAASVSGTLMRKKGGAFIDIFLFFREENLFYNDPNTTTSFSTSLLLAAYSSDYWLGSGHIAMPQYEGGLKK